MSWKYSAVIQLIWKMFIILHARKFKRSILQNIPNNNKYPSLDIVAESKREECGNQLIFFLLLFISFLYSYSRKSKSRANIWVFLIPFTHEAGILLYLPQEVTLLIR